MSSKITTITAMLWGTAILTLILYRYFHNELSGISFIIDSVDDLREAG